VIEHVDDVHEAGGSLGGRPRRQAQHGGVPAGGAGAQTERDPPAGDVVERDRLLGQRKRVAKVACATIGPMRMRLGDRHGGGQRRIAANHGQLRWHRQVRWS
jgi:hypothetical protein